MANTTLLDHSLTHWSITTQFGSVTGPSGRILAVNAGRKNALRVGRTYGSATERASALGCRTAKACLRIRRAAALPPKCSRPCSSSCRRLTTPMLDRRSAHTHTHQSVSTCRAITTPTYLGLVAKAILPLSLSVSGAIVPCALSLEKVDGLMREGRGYDRGHVMCLISARKQRCKIEGGMPTGKGSQSIRSAKARQPNFELSFRRSNGLLKLLPRTPRDTGIMCRCL